MKNILTILTCCISILSFSQESKKSIDTSSSVKITDVKWLENLGEKGIDMSNDSLLISDEFQKIIKDDKFKSTLFPKTYTWEQTITFIKNRKLKEAFWFFINLYPLNEVNKTTVIRSILAYSKLFKMEDVLVNTFYTYSFLDPEISVIKNGIPEIVRPDILEEKLRNVKEIVRHIQNYRKEQNKKIKK